MMKVFRDRIDAGIQLADELVQWENHPNTLVIGLPRGGVPVANEVAKALHLPLDVVCPRKIGSPHNKEFAIGAITETGEGIFSEDVIESFNISPDYIAAEVEVEKREARKRLEMYRQGKPARVVEGKRIILIDDGLATGSTMKAAIYSLRREGVQSIIVGIPVSPPDTLRDIQLLAEEVICLSTPPFFQAVGQFYLDFSSTEDDEVVNIMKSTRDS
jgi:putative phosphoribosyl transferase